MIKNITLNLNISMAKMEYTKRVAQVISFFIVKMINNFMKHKY